VGVVPRQPEREICAVMHVQLAFSAHDRIRDISGEGAGDVRAVGHVPIREHGRLNRLLDRADVRPARSRPAVPSRGGARGQRDRGRDRCDWPFAIGGGIQALGKDGAALVRAVPRADETREESRGTAQAARRRACTAPRRGSRPRLSRGAVDARVACAIVRVRELAAQHPHPEKEDVELIQSSGHRRTRK
jgi:hypothetical protein